MLASYNLLKQFVDLDGISPKEIADKLTFAGLEVEGITRLAEADKLVIGEIIECENHPDSDHLHVLKVNEGEKYGVEQIVCGAPNARKGLKVIVALPGCNLPAKDIVIVKSTIRGVESNGMCCSLVELGVDKAFLKEEQVAGIEELPLDAPVGEENVLGYLGLDDTILDINVLANRSDCLSIYSLAKEVAALFNRKLNIPEVKKYDEKPSEVSVASLTEDCPQFSLKVVKDVVTKESPKWLKSFLMSQGIRSINNIVDIGNYVMVLTGQPLHMYDLDKVASKSFVVKNDFEGKVVALDEKEYELKCGDLVVTTGDKVGCIAGVMGVNEVAVDASTKNIAIEAANFKSSTVRRTSVRLGLSSDSSAHFIKGINPHQDVEVLALCAQLLVELADAKIVEETTRYSVISDEKTKIECSVDYINKRLGTKFDKELIFDVLNKLQIETKDIDGNNFIAVAPYHRIDLKCDADLSEEIIRYVGFDKIEAQLPFMATTTGGYTPSQTKRLQIRELLIDNGINEAMTYTLVSPKENEEFVLLNNDEAHKIFNPMTVDHSIVRRGIVKSLLNTVSYNLDHQQENLQFFEIAQVNTVSEQYEELAVVLNGNKEERGRLSQRPYDFYDIHGILDSIFALLGIEKNRYKEERLLDSPFYHPGRSTKILFGKKVVGVVGQVHPSMSKDLGETYVLDLNLTEILNLKTSPLKMQQISKFPAVTRDLALVVKKEVLAQDLIRTIKKAGKSIVKDVQIFDVYEGEHMAFGLKSVAITITFQDDKKTLVDKDIVEATTSIMNELFKVFKAELRK
jgi:phenylalanyl-tRNA synthetase beta chain